MAVEAVSVSGRTGCVTVVGCGSEEVVVPTWGLSISSGSKEVESE
jgi:hypothetical protein